jgi:UDPglucose 6-dehydrogenase
VKIGIVGFGFVGTAVYEFFKDLVDVKVYDLYKKDISVESLNNLLDDRILFVCLPTPMKKSGECDTSIISSVLDNLNNLSCNKNTSIVIKSTIPPGSTELFINTYQNLRICFNPEFLTEANFVDDFKNQDRVILGTHEKDYFENLKSLYRLGFPNIDIIHTKPVEAEMVKYVANTFLATKVSFANEIYDICNFLDIDYDTVVDIARIDSRLGDSHWQVPGPDGKRGFGGSCFPKDINALISFCKTNNIELNTIASAWDTNLKVRPEQDWKELKGRAVSESDS